MGNKQKFLLLAVFCMSFFAVAAHAAVNLTGTTSLERTADTATMAKDAAMTQARRDIIVSVLSRYADPSVVRGALDPMPDSELIPLVSTSSIANERSSATAYTAEVTMTLDKAAVMQWMATHNIPNYMAAAETSGDRTPLFFYIGGGLRQWAALMTALRVNGLDKDMELKTMQGKNISATIPAGMQSEYMNAMRNLGWRVSDTDGILRIYQ